MKKGFTLIELLIVTVVIVALMGIMFRLTGIAGSASATETTVYRMQRLENCLSGYYAAFGAYPQVPLQGKTRNIFRKTHEDYMSVQSDDPKDVWPSGIVFDPGKSSKSDEYRAYQSVEAACRAQPVAASYPPPSHFAGDTEDSIKRYEAFQAAVNSALSDGVYSDSDEKKIRKWARATLEDISSRPGFLNPFTETKSINKLQLFRFGVMSFLLPRFRFMLGCAYGSRSGTAEAFNNSIDAFVQWTDNNTLPPRLDSGVSYASWKEFCDVFGSDDDWQIDLIPSQAACARWMPNLSDDVVSGPRAEFFGIVVSPNGGNGIPRIKDAGGFSLYFPGGFDSGSDSRGYPLLTYTVRDGWGNDFYYYSPAPYQSYTLWSAGANGYTFPPWVDLEQLNVEQRKNAVMFMSDDIKYMSTGK